MKGLVAELMARIGNQISGGFDNPIFFIHIPKCAGTSVDRAIKREYRTLSVRRELRLLSIDAEAMAKAAEVLKGTAIVPEDDDAYFWLGDMLSVYYLGMKRALYVSGHVRFCRKAFDQYGNRFDFVTLIREPVDRFISEYYYNRQVRNSHRFHQMSIDEYLETDFAKGQSRQYLYYIGGSEVQGLGDPTAMLNVAKENAKAFRLIGISEQMDKFVERFQEIYGRKLPVESRNIGTQRRKLEDKEITASVRNRIEEMCSADKELYDYIAAR